MADSPTPGIKTEFRFGKVVSQVTDWLLEGNAA